MSERYLRNIQVTVGDLRVKELYIRFRIRKEITATPAEGMIDIYNLSEENETRVRQRGQDAVIEVGYGEAALERLFSGTVRRVERQRTDEDNDGRKFSTHAETILEGLDRITRVHVGGALSVTAPGQSSPRAAFLKSYEEAVSTRTVVADAITALGLQSGSLDAIPADAMEKKGFKFNGDARVFLTYHLRPYGLHWFIEDGIVHLSEYKKSSNDRAAGAVVTISERTGMIGTPTVTDDGIRVKTLINPHIGLNTRIKVDSEVLRNRGQELSGAVWKVVEAVHQGDNWGGPFETMVEGRPLS